MSNQDKREGYYATIKNGDMVVVWNRIPMCYQVSGVTPSGRIKVGHMTFRPDGSEVGSDCRIMEIVDITTERGQRMLIDAQRREVVQKLRRILKLGYWSDELTDVPLEALTQALEILQAGLEVK